MTRVVVDASVCVKWFLPEQDSDAASRYMDAEYSRQVPDILYPEIGNVFWKRARRGDMSEERALTGFAELLEVPFHVHEHMTLMPRALEIAFETGRSVYDSLYLSLAESQECVLVTADEKLYNSLKGGPYGMRLAWVRDGFDTK